jgi:hypothetical protein
VQKTEEENHDEYVRMIIKEYGEEKIEERKEIRKNATMEEVEDEDAPEIFYDALDHCHDPTPLTPHWKEMVPPRFHEFTKVFDKEKSERMPLRKP